MKTLKDLLLPSLVIAGVLLAATAAKADSLSLTLAAPYQNGDGGDTLAFDATITNNSATDIAYLNGDTTNLNGDAAGLTVDDSPYYSDDFPATLAPGASYTGLLFNVDIANGTAPGLYTGSFAIDGAFDDGGELNDLATANFDVNVTPEPSSFLLLSTGLLALGAMAGRKLVS